MIWDLASTNGTFVNGARIVSATAIQENDESLLGTTLLVLKIIR